MHKLLTLSLILFSVAARGQEFLKTSGQRIVDARGENVLLRGMGFGGWLLQEGYMLRIYRDAQQHKIRERIENLVGPEKTQEFYDAWLANDIRKIDIDSMKSWGFNSVRLPMHYNLFTLPVEKEPVAGKQTWLDKGFGMVDSLLSWCAANNLYLILDLHAAPGGQGSDVNISDRDPGQPSLWQSEANRQKTIALWHRLAERYRSEKWIGGYDILNEPNWGFADYENDKNGLNEKDNGPLRKLMMDITAAIREVDKNHIIIIEGNGWGNNYNGIFPLWDDNTVISFHKYWSYNDESTIAYALRMREEQNAPIWLGESGENSNVWFTQAIQLAESHNIGWAWWPLKKLGSNNPLQIRLSPGYDKLLACWNGEGVNPSAEEAYQTLMSLAENTKLENCIYHKDVIDAMFRQVRSSETKPFNPNRLMSSLTMAAADYDLGRNGQAYMDMDTANYWVSGGSDDGGNLGRAYRNDGVDIYKAESGDGYYVGEIKDGEWLQYTIAVPDGGRFQIDVQVSSKIDGGRFTLAIDGSEVAANGTVPNTGGYESWKTVSAAEVQITKGRHTLVFKAEQGDFNFRSVQLTRR